VNLPRSAVLLAVVPLALLGACGSKAEPSASSTVTATVTESASSSATASDTATATPTPSGPAQCATADLKASIDDGDGAMGSIYYTITITNDGSAACKSGGYGGVSYVGGEAGTEIGAPATRDDSVKPTAIVLQPGESMKAQLQETQYENYDQAQCQPVKVQGLKIIPPDQTEPLFVPHKKKACSNAQVQLLSLQPYVKA
jgi:hypothetical protein